MLSVLSMDNMVAFQILIRKMHILGADSRCRKCVFHGLMEETHYRDYTKLMEEQTDPLDLMQGFKKRKENFIVKERIHKNMTDLRCFEAQLSRVLC